MRAQMNFGNNSELLRKWIERGLNKTGSFESKSENYSDYVTANSATVRRIPDERYIIFYCNIHLPSLYYIFFSTEFC